jgi:hypothetical protein
MTLLGRLHHGGHQPVETTVATIGPIGTLVEQLA